MTPIVRVIMPAYNARRFIIPAIESIQRQTLGDWELVVVDGGSTDDTAEIVSAVGDRRISLIHQDNSGPETARQRGLEGCRAAFIAAMDGRSVVAIRPEMHRHRYPLLTRSRHELREERSKTHSNQKQRVIRTAVPFVPDPLSALTTWWTAA
jgi:glycosyltransferase EpsJ